jgi:exoribonuclease-2
LILDVRDKIEIKLEDGQSARVRDKDLVLLHEGPAKALPSPAEGGDFDTARRMLDPGSSLPWAEMAELVFGEAGPAQALACFEEASKGLLFRLDGSLPKALSDEEAAEAARKRERKASEGAERAAFLERAKKARSARKKAGSDIGPDEPPFEESDERYLAEIEALAYGNSAKSRILAELGISESPEAAQAFLVTIGRWDWTINPHPYRAGCPLGAPVISLGPELGDLPRRDLGEQLAWAIDNAWSADPDDAIAWDGECVWVHVADPASTILPDSEADREALSRGSTLYLPELTSPMLPREALERFGLGLGAPAGGSTPSPALSFRIRVAEDGSIDEVEALPTIVRVRRESYGSADRLVDSGAAPDLEALAGVAERRRSRRVANGAVEIDIPEVRVRVEGEGRSRRVEIEALPRDRSSGLVREMMLLAGEAAARWAFERGLAFPFYSQEAPSDMGPAALGELSAEGELALSVQFARRRLMRSGLWGPGPAAHRGLGLPFYAQVTSPLRRYQDLLGHMQLRSFLAGRELLDADEVSRRCAMAQAASSATRQAERNSDLHWTIAYLEARPGWTGEAVLVGGAGPGAWQAYIPELGLETRLKRASEARLDARVPCRLARADACALEVSFEALSSSETH